MSLWNTPCFPTNPGPVQRPKLFNKLKLGSVKCTKKWSWLSSLESSWGRYAHILIRITQFQANLKVQPLLSGISSALHHNADASFLCPSGTGCFGASADLLSWYTHVYQDRSVLLTAHEIVVNLLTWSLGFPLMKCEMSTRALCPRRCLVARFVLSHRLLKKQHSLGP